MTERLRQMERVMEFRATRERMGEVALAAATARLREAERKLSLARDAEFAGAQEAMRALEDGGRRVESMSLALRRAFGLDCERYEKERRQREEGVQQAQAILRARRVEHEQAVAMHRDMRADLLAQEDRRTQTETVDRFLARSRWSSARVGVKSLTQAA